MMFMWIFLSSLLSVPDPVCDEPIFRYALYMWPASKYEVLLSDPGSVFSLDGKNDAASFFPSNGPLRVVNLDGLLSEEHEMLYTQAGRPQAPFMILRYPTQHAFRGCVWSAPLSKADVETLLRSPAREDIAKRLLEGQAAVWVLLECEDQEKNARVRTVLEEQLTRLERSLRLPPAATETEIRFSVINVRYDDPREEVLVRMLLHSEEDLPELREDPMVFPVFGRGRALWALVGAGIIEDNITEACEFLVGPCPCLVKELNPGTDLLIDVDWERELSAPLPLTGLSALMETKETPSSKRHLVSLIIVFSAILLLGLVFLRRIRRK